MMKCPNCSESVPNEYNFCLNCGFQIKKTDDVKTTNQQVSSMEYQPQINQGLIEKDTMISSGKNISEVKGNPSVLSTVPPQVGEANVKKDQPVKSLQLKNNKKGRMKGIAIAIVLLLVVSGMSMVYLNTNDSDSPNDLDNDGYPDKNDDFPDDPSASLDTDHDGYPDEWNSGMTQDDSTTGLYIDAFPYNENEWIDSDNDGKGNNVDSDDDNDGYEDNLEISEQTDPLNPLSTPPDADKDYIPDSMEIDDDNDGYNDTLEISEGSDPLDNNSIPIDTDSDFTPDSIDVDDDNDGVLDEEEIEYGADPKDAGDVQTINGALIYTKSEGTRGEGDSGYLIEDINGTIGQILAINTDNEDPGDGIYTIITSTSSMNFIHEQSLRGTLVLDEPIKNQSFENIEVEVNTISYFIEGYTYGIGITDNQEFAFMYHGEAPTLFTDVTLSGTVLPGSVFLQSDIFASELFGPNGMLNTTLKKFNINYTGDNLSFLYVDDIQYELRTINGDIYAHTTLGELEIVDYLETSGIEYLKSLTDSLNDTTVFIMGEENNTLEDFTLWGILLPYGGAFEFDGIVNVIVAESNLQPFIKRLGINYSVVQDKLPINLKIGICLNVDNITTRPYLEKDVSDLWEMTNDDNSMIENVKVRSNAIIFDLESASDKLQDYFGEYGDFTIINKITSYVNPAIAILFDLDASRVNRVNTDELMHQIAIAIIPDFQGEGGGFQTYEFSGVLYRLGAFFESDTDIPLIVVESFTDEPAPLVLNLNVVSVCLNNYTIGYGSDGSDRYLIISDEPMPAFFCNITVEGVILPVNLLWLLAPDFLDYNGTIKDMLDSWEIDLLIPDVSVLYVHSFEYRNTITVKGDPYTILSFDSEEENDDTFDSIALGYVKNILNEYLNAQLIILGSVNTTLGNMTFWFIYSTENLTEDELQGLPTLQVSEMDYSIFDDVVGYEFITGLLDSLGITIRIGTVFEDDPIEQDTYTEAEISDIWDIILGADTTAVGSIKTESFAFVVTLEDALKNIDSLFGSSDNTDRIEYITSFANPAFAFLIDKNMFDIFTDDNTTLTDVLAIGFIPDYDQVEYGNLNYFRFEGVVYNLTNFLNLDDVRGIPLYVIDSYEQKAPTPDGRTRGEPDEPTHLSEIMDVAYPDVTWFKTHGFISGTTAKTVAEAVDFLGLSSLLPGLKLICEIIEAAPLDIGLYVVSEKVEDITYTVPVIVPTVSKGKTFFGGYAEITGFYINLDDEIDRIEEFIETIDNMTGGFVRWFKDVYSNLIGTLKEFFGITSSLELLEGIIIASTINSLPNPSPDYFIENLEVEETLLDSENRLFMNVKVDASKRCTATVVVTTPDGIIYTRKQNTYIDSEFSLDFNITDVVEGTYNISAYLVSYFDVTHEIQDIAYLDVNISFPVNGTTSYDTGNYLGVSRMLRNDSSEWRHGETWSETIGEKIINSEDWWPHGTFHYDDNDVFQVFLINNERLKVTIISGIHHVALRYSSLQMREFGEKTTLNFTARADGFYTLTIIHKSDAVSGSYELQFNITYDSDYDGVADDEDIDKDHDLMVDLTLMDYAVYDIPGYHYPDTDVDMYFIVQYRENENSNWQDCINGNSGDNPIDNKNEGNFYDEGISMPYFDYPDFYPSIEIKIELIDDDTFGDDYIDISTEDDDRYELILTYNPLDETWVGDDDDGDTKGDEDSVCDYNGSLKYDINTFFKESANQKESFKSNTYFLLDTNDDENDDTIEFTFDPDTENDMEEIWIVIDIYKDEVIYDFIYGWYVIEGDEIDTFIIDWQPFYNGSYDFNISLHDSDWNMEVSYNVSDVLLYYAPKESDEWFYGIWYTLQDTNGDGLDDKISLEIDPDTNGQVENITVIMEVENDGIIIDSIISNFTIYEMMWDSFIFNWTTRDDGIYDISIKLHDSRGKFEDDWILNSVELMEKREKIEIMIDMFEYTSSGTSIEFGDDDVYYIVSLRDVSTHQLLNTTQSAYIEDANEGKFNETVHFTFYTLESSVNIGLELFDDDESLNNERIDIDSIDNGDQCSLNITYDIASNTWIGDDIGNSSIGGYTEGNGDGSADGSIWYNIRDNDLSNEWFYGLDYSIDDMNSDTKDDTILIEYYIGSDSPNELYTVVFDVYESDTLYDSIIMNNRNSNNKYIQQWSPKEQGNYVIYVRVFDSNGNFEDHFLIADVELHENNDVTTIVIDMWEYTSEDVDWGTDNDLYFVITLLTTNDVEIESITSEVYDEADSGNFSEMVNFTIASINTEVKVIIEIWDDDYPLTDRIDIDSIDDDDSSSLNLLFNLTTESWTGDDSGDSSTGGFTEGNGDGDGNGSLEYNIHVE